MGLIYGGLPGIPKGEAREERSRLNGREFQGIALAGRLCHACRGALGKTLESRLRSVPGAWRMWRAGCALLGRAMDALFLTVPDDQFERLWVVFTRGTIDISLPRASGGGGEIVPVHADALITLCEAAMRSECAICLKEGGHVRSCRLGRALAGCLEPDSWETSTCAWRDQALAYMKEQERL